MRLTAKECWPWWCCGPAVKKVRRIERKRGKRAWKNFEHAAN